VKVMKKASSGFSVHACVCVCVCVYRKGVREREEKADRHFGITERRRCKSRFVGWIKAWGAGSSFLEHKLTKVAKRELRNKRK